MRPGVTLYFIRHGETDWNAERRYQGQMDIPLNETGRRQAERNGLALRAHLPRIAEADYVSSPLGRALETMEIVRQTLGLDARSYRVDAQLKELSYGSWEGQLQDDLPRLDPEGLIQRGRDPFRWRPPGGESYADLLARTVAWLSAIEKDTVIAAHGGISRCVRAHLLELDPETIPDLSSPQDRVLVIERGRMAWV